MTVEALEPGSVVGIVGGGQLGRMLAQAAAKLGLKASILSPDEDSPAFEVAAFRHCAAYEDSAALERFAEQADIVTFEFENIPADALAIVEKYSRLAPPRRALEIAQDRIKERRFLTELGLPCAPYEEVDGAAAIAGARSRLMEASPGAAFFLKRATLGYDGKGQIRLESGASVEEAESWLGNASALLETEVDFHCELSVLCVRSWQGETIFYDVPRNVHRGGILRESLVSDEMPNDVVALAREHAGRIATALDYTGLLTVEMFWTRDDAKTPLLVNEIAPRVHNSGHWTREACAVSQFENHIRAIAGWPLGDPVRHADARMVNLLGDEAHGWRDLLAEDPARSLTLYGKSPARPGRKMGHYVELKPRA